MWAHTRIRILFMIYSDSDRSSKENILIANNKHTHTHGKLHSIQSFDKRFKIVMDMNVVELKMAQMNQIQMNEQCCGKRVLLSSLSLPPLAVFCALFKLFKRSEDKKKTCSSGAEWAASARLAFDFIVSLCARTLNVCRNESYTNRANKKGNSALRNNENNAHKYTLMYNNNWQFTERAHMHKLFVRQRSVRRWRSEEIYFNNINKITMEIITSLQEKTPTTTTTISKWTCFRIVCLIRWTGELDTVESDRLTRGNEGARKRVK